MTDKTAADVASAFRISERQVQRLVQDGLPYTPIGKRGKRFDLDECRRWLREFYRCQSLDQKKAASKSLSASTIDAYTAVSRRVQVRAMPSESKPSSESPPASAKLLSLATRR